MNISNEMLEELIGFNKDKVFNLLTREINLLYDMDTIWNTGGKKWNYEYKYRRASKTLCAFYFKEKTLGFMIIFGKKEREEVEKIRNELSKEILEQYDISKTFHDGKWVMFELTNCEYFNDFKKLLYIKRKPNKKVNNKI